MELTCPRCGVPGLPLLFGMPSDEGFALAAAGKVLLAGCIVRPAVAGCPSCGAQWGEDGQLLEDEDPPPGPPISAHNLTESANRSANRPSRNSRRRSGR